MESMSAVLSSAKGLSRNPLGIIALFIMLIYGVAALTLGAATHLLENERYPIVWFLVLFPVLVLVVFSWLVSGHHEKLYAPADYKDDKSFLDGLSHSKKRRVAEIVGQQDAMKDRVQEIVKGFISESYQAEGEVNKQAFEQTMQEIESEIDKATSITIDAREFLDDNKSVYKIPVAAYGCFGDLTDEVYFMIHSHVRPYHYGVDWLLCNSRSSDAIRNMRMIERKPAGKPYGDPRTLKEVGINPGDTLIVKRV